MFLSKNYKSGKLPWRGVAPEAKTAKWSEILHLAFMSGEESGEEEGGSPRPVVYVNRRHRTVNKFLKQIDDRVETNKTRRMKIQTLRRLPGLMNIHMSSVLTKWGKQHKDLPFTMNKPSLLKPKPIPFPKEMVQQRTGADWQFGRTGRMDQVLGGKEQRSGEAVDSKAL